MKSARFFSLAFLILIFAFSTLLYAGVPQMINYQGKITTPTGALVDTTVQITFTIYDDSTTGNVLWADTVGSVAVEKGIFSVLLGSINPIPDSVFDGSVRYLGVKVGGDPEMTPRKAMVSVAYAYRAGITDGGGGDCGWVDDGAVVRLETGSDKVGIGTTTPDTYSKLHVQHDNRYAGYFTSDHLSIFTHVIHSEFTGSGTSNAKAVFGKCTPEYGYGYGGYFQGGFTGVYGEVINPTGNRVFYGVRGYVDGIGTKCGLSGSANGWGENFGVRAFASGGDYNFGIYASAAGGVTNYGGYFHGDGVFTGTMTKGGGSFKIDHPLDPENKYLLHSSVESADMMNVYNGNVILDASGEATVQLPAYFEALNRDFRYQLTAIGAPGPNLYIAAKIANNQFTIAGGEPGMEVSWQVTGIRHDKFAEANRIQVEVEKPENEQGKYLHPEAYNLGEEYDIHYEQNKKMKERMEEEKMD